MERFSVLDRFPEFPQHRPKQQFQLFSLLHNSLWYLIHQQGQKLHRPENAKDPREKYLVVGEAKTAGGTGRTIPLNSLALEAVKDHAHWYKEKFGGLKPEWYVFPFGKPQPTDPTRPCATFKTVWTKVRADAGVNVRWQDNRHTLITELAESGAGEQTI
jgi:hypothetical protein